VLFTVIRISAGTADILGLKRIKTDVQTTTAYLLWGENCVMKCAFCPQSGESSGMSGRLGRVNWPAFFLPELEHGLSMAEEQGTKRICLQGVRAEGTVTSLSLMIKQLKIISQLPVCVSAWIENESEAEELFQAGADRVSIALDAAGEAVYSHLKGGSLRERKELLIRCARRWPGRISSHLICGLGESEQELLAETASLLKERVTVALFAFTPLKGTRLSGHLPPETGKYRRVQAASYLLREKLISFSQLEFSQKGRLLSFGIPWVQLKTYLEGGEAFRTSGCPDCNRPYYNERPGGFIYNYPRPLTEQEQKEAIACLAAGIREGMSSNEGKMAVDL
jgi:lipoyl synthase